MQFIYLADTHLGGSDELGYRQQPRYLKQTTAIFAGLKAWLQKNPKVDFIIHGGDIVDVNTPENIALASKSFAGLACPCYLSLGNHDLMTKNAVENWLQLAPEFFPAKQVDFTLIQQNVRLDFICSHWGSTAYFWNPEEKQVPYFSPKQREQLLTGTSGQHRILVTHAPSCGLPQAQTGLTETLHPPEGDFESIIKTLAKQLQLNLVLGAHNHMNLALKFDNTHLVSTAAFSEAPFEFKLFEFTEDKFSMTTIFLANQLDFRADYNYQRAFIQGRPCDRSFTQMLN